MIPPELPLSWSPNGEFLIPLFLLHWLAAFYYKRCSFNVFINSSVYLYLCDLMDLFYSVGYNPSISFLLMLKFFQIWPVWALPADSDVLEKYLHDFLRTFLFSGTIRFMTNLDSILKSRDITLPTKVHQVKAMVFPVSCMDVRVGLWRKLSAGELMLLNCCVGEDSWESLGLQGDPTSPS